MKCKHIECENQTSGFHFCKFHAKGGIFGTGETYQQYQIIEADFINFIKIVPLNEPNNLEVYSPLLRDIIIRGCVQIEIFFKEWAKFECANNNCEELIELYNKIDNKTKSKKGARNWNFPNYFIFKTKHLWNQALHVRDLDTNIQPFGEWQPKDCPDWWDVYNLIKHDGFNSKKKVNLKVALNVLGALFSLHCANNYTRNYLKEFSALKLVQHFFKADKLQVNQITTPLDSKLYLFKDVKTFFLQNDEISVTLNENS